MAKKKRKRPGASGRSVGTATTTRSRPGTAEPATVKPAPSTPGGPNRLERKEAARQARERLRRKMARQRVYRRAVIGVVVLAVVAGIVFLAARPKGSSLSAQEAALLRAAPQAAQAAGCGPIQTIEKYKNDGTLDRAHIGTDAMPTSPPLSSYASTPPTSGPHNLTPLPAGVYSDPPDVYQTVHSLEHAAVVIWYAPGTTSDELAKLQTFFAKAGEKTKVIVAPYNYPDQGNAGKLPQGKQMVMVAWHHMQVCNQVSLPVAFDFVAHYRYPAPKGQSYKGDAPEVNVPIG